MRIVIVEDEKNIREGIGKMIEAHTEHMVVGEASDGEEGLRMILRLKPDLVITDIRMPRKDGLTMIRELTEKGLSVHCVILSGYSEFGYAQKAIQYGVEDYLLKPLTVEDVRDMLGRVGESIQRERSLVYGQAESRLQDILFGNVEESQKNIEQLCRSCGFEPGMRYEMAAGYIGNMGEDYRKNVEKEVADLKKKYPALSIYLIYQESSRIFFCLVSGEAYKGEQREQFERSFRNQILTKYRGLQDGPVWTKEECGVNTLHKTAERLKEYLSYALVLRDQEWITAQMIEKYACEPYEYPLNIYNRLRNAVCREGSAEIRDSSRDFIAYMKEHSFSPQDVRQGFIKSYYLISDTMQDLDHILYERLKNSGILTRMVSAVTWRELRQAFDDMIEMVRVQKVRREDISNYVIQKAINYIKEHYNEGITLEELARKLEITPEYLSTLFKREMGVNFSIFLRRFRISHAKRLLKGTDMKVYEVAEAVGYGDEKYFARVFREEQGMSPNEYRQMN